MEKTSKLTDKELQQIGIDLAMRMMPSFVFGGYGGSFAHYPELTPEEREARRERLKNSEQVD